MKKSSLLYFCIEMADQSFAIAAELPFMFEKIYYIVLPDYRPILKSEYE